MSKPFGRFRRFLRELRRRKVYRVAGGYLVAAFVVLQLAGAFEVTPDGVRRAGSTPSTTNRGQYAAEEAPEPSVAVLPLSELGQQEAETLTEWMHDALLTRLSNVGELMVISRSSVQKYSGTEITTAEIARELGVKWVVEGGVQEMGDQIQVYAQLVDPVTNSHAL